MSVSKIFFMLLYNLFTNIAKILKREIFPNNFETFCIRIHSVNSPEAFYFILFTLPELDGFAMGPQYTRLSNGRGVKSTMKFMALFGK